MSISNDPDRFFQTTDSIEERDRKAKKSTNKHGAPIQLPSKILAVIADPSSSGRIYVAEAAGTARRVVLETGYKAHIFRGPTTPLTSLALSPLHPTLYAGSWDKTIWSWDIPSRAPRKRFYGHSDFVKCVVVLPTRGLELLISGSSDSTIILWNTDTGDKLQTLKDHSMGVLALAIDPLSYPDPLDDDAQNSSGEVTGVVTLFSASSSRLILRHTITPLPVFTVPFPRPTHTLAHLVPPPLDPHPTSVFALTFSPSGDLHTASADGTSLRLSYAHDFTPDTTLVHGDYVRTVAVSRDERYVVTAGRSEDVVVWEGEREVGRWVGHWDEVMGVVIVGEGRGRGERIVSVGIDGTVRVWSLDVGEMEKARVEREDEERGVEMEEEEEVKGVEGGLTAEEEAELAELMEE